MRSTIIITGNITSITGNITSISNYGYRCNAVVTVATGTRQYRDNYRSNTLVAIIVLVCAILVTIILIVLVDTISTIISGVPF